jgi:DNA-binding HxlR family transcriptional regulator
MKLQFLSFKIRLKIRAVFSGLKARFEEPDDAIIDEFLRRFAIDRGDGKVYETLKHELRIMIGRKTREKLFLEFSKRLSSQLAKKVREELVRREREASEMARNEIIRKYEEEIARSREQWTAEVVPKVLKIIGDQQTYDILKALNGGDKGLEKLKRTLGLENDELVWRLKTLTDLALIRPSNGGSWDEYSISDTGREAAREMERLEGRVYAIEHIRYLLALKAVGDKSRCKELLTVVDNGRLRGHEEHVRRMMENVNTEVRRLSQAIFESREMGVSHAKHLLPPGVQITDHEAMGRLLVLGYWLRDLIGSDGGRYGGRRA